MSKTTTVDWTDEKVSQLTELFYQNLSFRAIGRKMNISRQAACGKASRLKLRRVRLLRVVEPAKPKVPRPVIIATRPTNEPLLADLPARGLCRYIEGDPLMPGWSSCAAPVKNPSSSWCAYHYFRVFDVKKVQA